MTWKLQNMHNMDVYKLCMTVFNSIIYKHVPKYFMSEHYGTYNIEIQLFRG